MGSLDLPIEFNVEISTLAPEFKHEIEQTLWKLADDHQDMTGASITISQPTHGETPYLFRVSIVVYMRPENVYADEKSENLGAALSGAKEAIVRKIRGRREKLGEPWKRSDLQIEEDRPKKLK
jgi:ribosome-associated translation inhibitor RaiA